MEVNTQTDNSQTYSQYQNTGAQGAENTGATEDSGEQTTTPSIGEPSYPDAEPQGRFMMQNAQGPQSDQADIRGWSGNAGYARDNVRDVRGNTRPTAHAAARHTHANHTHPRGNPGTPQAPQRGVAQNPTEREPVYGGVFYFDNHHHARPNQPGQPNHPDARQPNGWGGQQPNWTIPYPDLPPNHPANRPYPDLPPNHPANIRDAFHPSRRPSDPRSNNPWGGHPGQPPGYPNPNQYPRNPYANRPGWPPDPRHPNGGAGRPGQPNPNSDSRNRFANRGEAQRRWLDNIRRGQNPNQDPIEKWLDRIKRGGLDINAIARGKYSPFLNKLQPKDPQLDYPPNVHLVASSNSGFTPGYMDMPGPGALSFFARALEKHLKDPTVDSLAVALGRFAGRRYEHSPTLEARPLYWRAKNIGNESYKDSPFNVCTRNKQDTKTIYLGVSGWGPESTFKRCIDRVGSVFKNKFDASVIKLYNGRAPEIDRAFGKVAEYARRHPDKPISLVFHVDTHGNNYGKGNTEGSGRGSTLNIDEMQLKNLLWKHFGKQKNVGVNLLVSACYGGGYLT